MKVKKLIKTIFVFIICVFFAVSCGGGSKEENIFENEKPKLETEETKEEKKEENSNKLENFENTTSSKDAEQVFAIYDPLSNTITSFGKNLNDDKIFNDFKTEITNSNSKLFSITNKEDGKIELDKVDKIEVEAVYIGLSDTNVAEFSRGDKYFRLSIDDNQMEILEELGDDTLIKISIENPDNMEENCKLIEIL